MPHYLAYRMQREPMGGPERENVLDGSVGCSGDAKQRDGRLDWESTEAARDDRRGAPRKARKARTPTWEGWCYGDWRAWTWTWTWRQLGAKWRAKLGVLREELDRTRPEAGVCEIPSQMLVMAFGEDGVSRRSWACEVVGACLESCSSCWGSQVMPMPTASRLSLSFGSDMLSRLRSIAASDGRNNRQRWLAGDFGPPWERAKVCPVPQFWSMTEQRRGVSMQCCKPDVGREIGSQVALGEALAGRLARGQSAGTKVVVCRVAGLVPAADGRRAVAGLGAGAVLGGIPASPRRAAPGTCPPASL
ncbi:hypothetical protein Micbo1qcDRAFT_170150 [Microdochium bolleyi]|uniref:Uncharacterized protein n=1 Tax=Microdochium bolleyi TaxID=196109 RepID=A0A136JGQ9_9PEZI|nr:hypothetical protein Micbo1qcDRAFT_170150 [Microdochium bolleyi]